MFYANIPTRTLREFIWHFAKPYSVNLLLLFGVAIIWAADLSFRSYMVKLLLDRIASGEEFSSLLVPTGLYLLSGFLLNSAFYAYDLIKLHTIPAMQANILQAMTAYIEGHAYSFFQTWFSGSIAHQIQEMLSGVREIIKILIDRFFANIMAFGIAAATLATVSPVLSLIVVVWAAMFLMISYHFSKRSSSYAQNLSLAQNNTIGALIDSLSNIVTVKLFARYNHELALINRQLDNQIATEQQLERYTSRLRACQGFLADVVLFGCLLTYLLYARYYNLVTVGDFALTTSIAFSISDSIWSLSLDFISFSEATGRCKQALQLVQLPHAIIDQPGAQPLVVSAGQISFDKVSFIYNKQTTLFKNLSVTIPGGQKIGLVGFSGSGKSTFVQLITRIFEPQQGSISIDGQNIAQVTQDSLRQTISFIPQDPSLFNRSIRENIKYGLPTASDEAIIDAASKAQAYEFIQRLPNGLDTIIGDQGLKLSCGQRQRIAIARAILKNAPILILDEATAALDTEAEFQIQAGLSLLMQNKTVLVIAHRLTTIAQLDRILVFDKGNIIQDGTHSLLSTTPGTYAKLWSRARA